MVQTVASLSMQSVYACLQCADPLEDQLHFALNCAASNEIRSQYMDKFIEACPNIAQYFSNQNILFLALLDPFSAFLPIDIKEGWSSKEEAYKLSMNFFFHLHKKREKLIEKTLKNQSQTEYEDITKIIINVYENI